MKSNNEILETLDFIKKNDDISDESFYETLSVFLISKLKLNFVVIDIFKNSLLNDIKTFIYSKEEKKVEKSLHIYSDKFIEKLQFNNSFILTKESPLFKENRLLSEIGAKSCISVFILDSSNKPKALLSGISKNNHLDEQVAKIIFDIISLKLTSRHKISFYEEELNKQLKKNKEIEFELKNAKSVINDFPIGLAIIKLNGDIVFQNKILEKVVGKDVYGKKCKEIYSFSKSQCKNCVINEEFQEDIKKIIFVENFGNKELVWVIQEMMYYKGEKVILELFQDQLLLEHCQKQLNFSEEKFRLAFKNSPDAISLSKLDGTYIEINDSFTKIMGYNNEDVLGIKSTDLNIWANPQDRDKFVAGLKEKGVVENLEAEFITKDGDIKYGLVSATIIKLGDAPLILSITRDITERKKIEKELHRLNEEYESTNEELRQANDDLKKSKEIIEENQRNLKLIFDNSPVGLIYYDINGIIVDCNNKFVEIIGSSRKDLIGLNMLNLPDKKLVKELKKALNGKQGIYSGYYHSVTANKVTPGRVIFAPAYSDNKEVVGGLAIVEDETEKKKYEKDLNKLQKSIDNSLNEVYIFNAHNFKFSYLNKSALRNIGYSMDEMKNLTVLDIKPEFTIEKFKKLISSLLNQEKEFVRFETLQKRKDGSTYPVEVLLNIFEFEDQKEILAIENDITERKKHERELIQAKEKAEESEKLKLAFLHNMSHEIRTPLNAIMGFIDFLSENDVSEQTRKKYMSIVLKSGNQLLSIINDILTISSLETNQVHINITKVCANEVITDLMKTFEIQAKKQNILLYSKMDLSNEESIINTDRTKLIQILSNLISNALKFTQKGFIEFGYTIKNEKYLEFYVKDTGIGIETENFDRIFDRFSQAEDYISNKYGGTGLGLAISKGFVEKLGGEIWVESEKGKGSTFYFTLPYKKQ